VTGALVVLRRELAVAVGQPLAVASLVAYAGMVGLLALWFDDALTAEVASMRQPFFWMSACLLWLAPAITMRSFAEERRAGTLQLQATWPLAPAEIVVGKWLAAWILALAALATTAGYPLAIGAYGPLDPGPVVGGYLGLALLAGAWTAVGLAASAFADSQAVAFLAAVALTAGPWWVGLALPLVPGAWAPAVQAWTVAYHLGHFTAGVLDTRSVGFFALVTAVALRWAVLALEHRRLRP